MGSADLNPSEIDHLPEYMKDFLNGMGVCQRQNRENFAKNDNLSSDKNFQDFKVVLENLLFNEGKNFTKDALLKIFNVCYFLSIVFNNNNFCMRNTNDFNNIKNKVAIILFNNHVEKTNFERFINLETNPYQDPTFRKLFDLPALPTPEPQEMITPTPPAPQPHVHLSFIQMLLEFFARLFKISSVNKPSPSSAGLFQRSTRNFPSCNQEPPSGPGHI